MLLASRETMHINLFSGKEREIGIISIILIIIFSNGLLFTFKIL
jgi:hypothetical protein